jgi:hypothetical protein
MFLNQIKGGKMHVEIDDNDIVETFEALCKILDRPDGIESLIKQLEQQVELDNDDGVPFFEAQEGEK